MQSTMVRSATASEADAVHALVRGAYRTWVERLGREPSPMQDDYVQRIADGQLWVLQVEGEITGLVVLRDGPTSLLMPNIAVAPAAQGRGYGRQLIAFAEMEAKRRGYGEVRLFVNMLMVENIALYRYLGFVEIDRITGAGGDRTYVAMAKQVP